ncbi:hypothetical protein [Sphingobacterium tabacisoli]|uniref:Uncharacterized protein n=1 Tax=Sphingobacterium tabacisoli TaxID=2044855 RepID=A0ABW5L1C5_9SPHI|nr:hypothetical protein [Sphingobacterium tabacisoli]
MAIPDRIHQEFLMIKAAFESGSVTKMSQLDKQKSTRIAALIGMNQGRYGAKLLNPEDFSPSEITRMSLIINIDPGLIMNVIKNQLLKTEMERVLKNIKKEEEKKLAKTKKD